MSLRFALFGFIFAFLGSCSDGPDLTDPGDLSQIPYDPVFVEVDLPEHFPKMIIPADNPITKQGVMLGRHLFYDPILSSDGTISCSTCHLPKGNFTDNLEVSLGFENRVGKRSSMTLLNVAFNSNGFFWDGRAKTLEEQALEPIENPLELNESWDNVELKLQTHPDYPALFRKAFGITRANEISRDLAVKAIAQFERTLVSSGQSKYDKVISGEEVFTDEELLGHNIFFDIEPDISRHAECGHCHNAPLFTTNEYFNNGIDDGTDLGSFLDLGKGQVTGNMFDNGTFRVPALRNINHSNPYMHDGRFKTIEEVIDHYTTGGHPAINLGSVLRPLELSPDDRKALISFLNTLEDPDFLNNPGFQSPF